MTTKNTSRSGNPDRKTVMVIADDLTEEGGIRTRILGEMGSLEDFVSFVLVVKVRAKNLHLMRGFREWMGEHHPGVRIRFAPFFPHYALPVVREIIMIPNVLGTAVVCLMGAGQRRPSRVYSHNLECSLAGKLVARVLRTPQTADIHGDEIEENISITGWDRNGHRARFWRTLMRIVLRRCSHVVCVSRAHKSYLESTYGLTSRTSVIPCCVSGPISVEDHRGATFLDGHKSFTRPSVLLFYSGSSARWQMIDSMVRFLVSLREAQIDCGMIMLLSDKTGMERVTAALPPEIAGRILVDSVDHETALSVASMADIAFLFRENIPLNNISSPTKFAEYLISGLPVLVTEAVGDYSEAVVANRIGKVVDLARLTDASYVSSIVQEILADGEMRNRCRRYASERLTWDVHRESLEQAFQGE